MACFVGNPSINFIEGKGIGSKVRIDVSGDGMLLSGRKSGQCIAQGSLEF